MNVHSMTGFGRVEYVFNHQNYSLEIKTLNSKQIDVYTRIPGYFKSKELDIRTLLNQAFERGKVDLFLAVQTQESVKIPHINQTIAKEYLIQIQNLEKQLGIEGTRNYTEILLRSPDIMSSEEKQLNTEEWSCFWENLNTCVALVNQYREKEGNMLANDLQTYVNQILSDLEAIKGLETGKEGDIRKKLLNKLKELLPESNIDKNRLEQEILYYLEKMDISEEKIRLKTNCDYFLETLNSKDGKGRKLGFIAQEIGREINTIGSKCNDSDIQRYVVNMKDNLEKIKEQCANVL